MNLNKLYETFYEAIKTRDSKFFDNYLRNGGNVNEFHTIEILSAIARYGWKEMLIKFIDHGADVNYPSFWDKECRDHVKYDFKDEKCQIYFSGMYDIYSPLIISAQEEHYDCALILIEHGADVNYVGKYGFTSLTWCCLGYRDDNLTIIEQLIKYGADVNHKDLRGDTILHHAICNINVVKLLIEYGANINWKNNRGGTCLDQAKLCKCTEVRDYLEKVIDILSQTWYPELIEYYPIQFRTIVETLIVGNNRYDSLLGKLPLELIFEICTHVATHYTT